MKPKFGLLLVTLVICGISACSDVDPETKHFDSVFWHVWFMEMDEGDRKAVCWPPPEEAAKSFSMFGTDYVQAEQRAETLLRKACASYY